MRTSAGSQCHPGHIHRHRHVHSYMPSVAGALVFVAAVQHNCTELGAPPEGQSDTTTTSARTYRLYPIDLTTHAASPGSPISERCARRLLTPLLFDGTHRQSG